MERAGEPGTQSRGRNLDGSPGVAEMQREEDREEEEGKGEKSESALTAASVA